MRGLLVFLAIQLCLITYINAWCEPGQFQCQKGSAGCRPDDCLCLDGWRSTFPVSNSCEPYCGDGKVVTGEECDGGAGCCGCRCMAGWVAGSPLTADCVPVTVAPTTTTAPVTTTVPTTTTAPTAEGPVEVPANLLPAVEGSLSTESSGTVLAASVSYLIAHLLL